MIPHHKYQPLFSTECLQPLSSMVSITLLLYSVISNCAVSYQKILIGASKMAQQVKEDTCHQAQWLEFNAQGPHGRSRTDSCKLSSDVCRCAVLYTHPHASTHKYTLIHINKQMYFWKERKSWSLKCSPSFLTHLISSRLERTAAPEGLPLWLSLTWLRSRKHLAI